MQMTRLKRISLSILTSEGLPISKSAMYALLRPFGDQH